MYLYIYDEFVQEKRHERMMASVENRLTDLGITGKIIRLALFRQAGEQILDDARRGVTTVVIVGNDHTITKVLDAVVEASLPLGIIPIGSDNAFARMIGVPDGVPACDVLSARVIQPVDVGRLNGRRFVAGLRILSPEILLTCDDRYQVSLKRQGMIEIHNFTTLDSDAPEDVADPQDKKLEAVIRVFSGSRFFGKRSARQTRLPIERASIEGDELIRILCDGEEVRSERFQINIDDQALKVITGRSRRF